jgi:hypothetical protein
MNRHHNKEVATTWKEYKEPRQPIPKRPEINKKGKPCQRHSHGYRLSKRISYEGENKNHQADDQKKKFLIKYNHTLRDDFVLFCFSLELKEMKKKRFRKILPPHRHQPASMY